MKSAEERFLDRVSPEPNTGCWLWMGAYMRSSQYGRFWLGDRIKYAHRASYELFVGPIPEGLHIDHLCRVKECVNPAHLEPVTPQTNSLRGISFAAENSRKTHCPAAHAYTTDNVYVDAKNRRYCRACHRIRQYLRNRRNRNQEVSR